MLVYEQRFAVGVVVLLCVSAVDASIVVNYTADFGGNNTTGIAGLSARSTWSLDGDVLSILLENTSTSVPNAFEVSDSLLVSLAFSLGDSSIVSGDSARIGAGSVGLGLWDDLGDGDSVAGDWLWTNDGGGDLLDPFSQVISTSSGQGEGDQINFDGDQANVAGPFGGIASDPVIRGVPDGKFAVSNSIEFTVALSELMTEEDLLDIALSSVVEFGSDQQYLSAVPAPGCLALLGIAAWCGGPARRRRA